MTTSVVHGPAPALPMRPRRRLLRRVLTLLAAVVATLGLLLGGGFTYLYTTSDTSTLGQADFSRELTVPPLASSKTDAKGRRVFDLTMRTGEVQFQKGLTTRTWGFNGSYLGPTLRAKRGERVAVNVENTLPEASTVHWHGMHLPARMDGGPHQMVAPGGTWSPTWTVDQPASTLWYHPHPHGETETHVQRGLAGMFLVDDDFAASRALPDDYGRDDLPLIVQDTRFADDGSFEHDHSLFGNTGFLGDQLLVNGRITPHTEIRDERVRLRLLNGSSARILNLGFDDDRPFALVGTDGGLVEAPVSMERLQLSPGERAEIVVRMTPGEDAVLRSHPLDTGLDFWNQRFNGGDDSFDVLQLRAADRLKPSPDLPDRLASLEDLPRGENPDRTRKFELLGTRINRRDMDMNRIDLTVERGSEEVWEVTNSDGSAHNFHVHDVQFRVLDVDGREPPATMRGAKDTVFLRPGGTVRLALRFEGPSDPDVPYMYHCHLLYHEDQGMMGQFVVVEPGRKAGRVPPPEHSGGHDH